MGSGSDEGPLASFSVDRSQIAREAARHAPCLMLILVPSIVALALLFVDVARAAAALVFAAIAAFVVLPGVQHLFRNALRDDLVTRLDVHRDAVHARTRAGTVAIRWREIDRVTWDQFGEHWRRSEVYTRDGARLTITPWLACGQTCAFLLRHGAEARAFPWEYADAAAWAAPDHMDIRARHEAGVVEPARSGRSRCRTCGQLIPKGELRYGRPMLCPRPNQTTTHWHHLACAEANFPDEVAQARRNRSPRQ